MSDEEDVEVNVVSEAEDSSSNDGKKFKESLLPKTKLSFVKKPEVKAAGNSFGGKGSSQYQQGERRTEEWLELRGIDLEQWRKLSSHQKFLSEPRPNSPEMRKTEMTQTDSPGKTFCESLQLRRMQLGDGKSGEVRSRSRSPTDQSNERSKSPNIGKSPDRNSFSRCSKSRSRSPSPRSRSKSPTSTPNPMYTSFTISSILRRTDSGVKKNSFSGNVQQNLVLDAATNFLSHHPACTDPAMLSR
ncbi:hypothetical protein RUM43_012599 [Polyplax serrata]|uniref:Uncharacterized protein n=1 Tax=Polyplax serrata TaxID=468196 RepID=A0AAN8Q2Z1_POLSC